MKLPLHQRMSTNFIRFPDGLSLAPNEQLAIYLNGDFADVEVLDAPESVAKCADCTEDIFPDDSAIWDADHQIWFCSQECHDHWHAVKAEWWKVGNDGKPMMEEDKG